ncbi:MAG TPA: sigma-54 dependent transcriptional regulator [Smithellaceae bacterium]|nr:sigma-54 dependent transcriptional regulator [Smithellaceae bacterium]HRS88602.1 sigma-54 dependent transcriptional regulator [Smithellaceae bacterium]HRV25882.1 sigma-54 dependent transcriptional regulator [Smithellaceae bacterium]
MKEKKNKKNKILIIDDEEVIRDGCRQILTRQGYVVDCASNAREGLKLAGKGIYDLILLDVRMPEMSGLDILKKLKAEDFIAAKIIVITGYATIPLAVEAMRCGAVNFLAKPYTAGQLREAVSEALHGYENTDAQKDIPMLIGVSDYMKELKDSIKRIAQTDSTVLITGLSGTGKELVARTIHQLSRRSDKPFVPVDCSSLAENLMESELFGHVKGAFSGATESREGRFQIADKGTLFLDEISNINLNTQAKLLRVIQEQEVPRVGKSSPEKVDVRLIAATNKDLRAEIAEGKFREDLFYRLSVVLLDIKPLAEHKTDILPIAEHYLEYYRKKHKSHVCCLSEEAKKSLLSYKWPGNVRELKNTIERLCVMVDHDEVNLSDILYYGQGDGAKAPVVDATSGRVTLVDVEKEHIEKALGHFNFQINKTANFLGIDRKTLRIKMRNYGIKAKE